MQRINEYSTKYPGRHLRRLLICVAALLVGFSTAPAWGETDSDREYKVKAAFVLNFLKFIDGGRLNQAGDEAAGPIVVGVLGKLPSTGAFEELAGKEVKDRSIVVRRFRAFEECRTSSGTIPEQHPDIGEIGKCHLLFVCPSEKAFLDRILPAVSTAGMLTVADTEGFLEAGGVINFVIKDKKVRFEINLAAGTREKLQIRSSLLRLAIRIIEHDELEK